MGAVVPEGAASIGALLVSDGRVALLAARRRIERFMIAAEPGYPAND
jgi:hypothetical protein